jgi:hypothetical protein
MHTQPSVVVAFKRRHCGYVPHRSIGAEVFSLVTTVEGDGSGACMRGGLAGHGRGVKWEGLLWGVCTRTHSRGWCLLHCWGPSRGVHVVRGLRDGEGRAREWCMHARRRGRVR